MYRAPHKRLQGLLSTTFQRILLNDLKIYLRKESFEGSSLGAQLHVQLGIRHKALFLGLAKPISSNPSSIRWPTALRNVRMTCVDPFSRLRVRPAVQILELLSHEMAA